MSWLKRAEWRWMQSVDVEHTLSTLFDFRKYLIFFAEIYYFLRKHVYCQIYPEHLYRASEMSRYVMRERSPFQDPVS